MLLFWHDRYYRRVQGEGGIYRYTVENSDHFQLEQCNVPEEVYSKDHAGWPVVLIINNYPQLFGIPGIIPYDEEKNSFLVDQVDPKVNLDLGGLSGGRETLSYDPQHGRFMKFLMCNLRDESIFYSKSTFTRVFKLNKVKTPFDYKTVKQDPETQEIYCLLHEKLYRFCESGVTPEERWLSEEKMSMEEYNNLPYELTPTPKVLNAIAPNPEKIRLTRPSIWTMNKINQNKDDLNVHYLRKFGTALSVQDTNPLRVTRDFKEWETISYLSEAHREAFTNGFTTDLLHTIPINDTFPSIMYDDHSKKYFFYNRANIDIGCRYISVSESPDLINWSSNRMIRMDPEFSYAQKENYYVPSMMKYQGTEYVFAVMTFYHLRTRTLEYHYYVSMDGVNFDFVSVFHSHQVDYLPNQSNFHWNLNMMVFIPNSMYTRNQQHRMFFACHTHAPGYRSLNRLTVPQDRFTSLRSETKGEFLTTPLVTTSSTWRINCRTHENGSVQFMVGDWTSELITGDHFDYELIVPDDLPSQFKLRIVLHQAELFSLSGVEYLPIVDTTVPTKIRFAYREHTNVIGGKYRARTNQNGWREVDLPVVQGQDPVELVGDPIFQNQSTLITQKVKYSDGLIKEVILADNQELDEKDNYPETLQFVYQHHGTSATVFEVKLK